MAELPGFKRFEQVGITLSAGEARVVNATLGVGQVSETVTVNADEQPVLNAGKIDAGRNLTTVEVKNLPLVSRNPYNFALVQPGITGYENAEFGVPRLAANGTLMRINYQVDGNTNTEKDRAGLRLLPLSEVMVSEVKVVTAGYAPEFGQTMGLVYNAITPSGTNQTHGDASYLFRRKSFSAFPFPFTRPEDAREQARYQGRHGDRHARRADHQEQAALLRRLRADLTRSVGAAGHHHPAGHRRRRSA